MPSKGTWKFNKTNCKELHLGPGNLRYVYRLREELLECSPAEKDLGVLVDDKIDVSQTVCTCSLKANCILGCLNRGADGREREVIVLCYSALVQPHLEY